MLRLFTNNSPFTVIILFIFALLVKMNVLLAPVLPMPIPNHFIYNGILSGLNVVFFNSAFAFTLLSIVILFLQSLYLNGITIRHKLFPRNTYIATYVFIVLSSVYPQLNHFNETIFVNWLLLGAVDIMLDFSKTKQPRKLIYNTALLLSCAALFQCSFYLYFTLLFIGMVMYRPFNLGEWAVAILGYITPMYFLTSILFLFDKLYLLNHWWHIGISVTAVKTDVRLFIVTLTSLGVLFLTGVYALQKNSHLSNIYVRRDWISMFFYLMISVFAGFLTDATVTSAWLIVMPALSIVVTHAIALEKNKRFSNFIFYFSLIFLVFCLVANK